MVDEYDKYNEILNKVKATSYDLLGDLTASTWIDPLEFSSINGDVINLVTVDEFYIEQTARYSSFISNCLKRILHSDTDYKINFLTRAEAVKDTKIQVNTTPDLKTNLNPKYTFESFVIGENNRFAQAAAYAVSEAPGSAYNPLFIYGGVGLGKTHLMHAIGNEILKRSPSKKVLYVTSEKFTNDFINGIRDKSNEKFRDKYRNIDILLIDDIQFIAGKEGIQEEFFHTFNAISENKGQIVLTSDKPPKDINPLEERLKSRFEWGLMVDISQANYETRLAILRKKVQLENIVIDDLVLSNIATNIDSNIRELEGTLNKIVALASLTHSPITLDMAEKAVADIVANKEKVISPDNIKINVSKYYNVPLDDINSSKRSDKIAYARQVAMYLCRTVAKMQYKNIGIAFGNRDHSTVMHACDKIETELKNDANSRAHVDNLKNLILKTEAK